MNSDLISILSSLIMLIGTAIAGASGVGVLGIVHAAFTQPWPRLAAVVFGVALVWFSSDVIALAAHALEAR